MTTAAEAFITEVRSALSSLGTTVFDSIVIGDAPLQYVAVYPSIPHVNDGSLCTDDSGIARIQVTSVAAGQNDPNLGKACRGLAERVRDHLVDLVLTADDWRCGPIEHDFSNPPVRDEDVLERPTVFAADGYRFLVVRP